MVGAPTLLPKPGCSSSKQKARVTERVSKTCHWPHYTNANLALTILFHFLNIIWVPYNVLFNIATQATHR